MPISVRIDFRVEGRIACEPKRDGFVQNDLLLSTMKFTDVAKHLR